MTIFFSPCISKNGELVKTAGGRFYVQVVTIAYTAMPGKNRIRGRIPPQPPESLCNATQTLFLSRRISINTFFSLGLWLLSQLQHSDSIQ